MLQDIQMPDLSCPFPPAISPFAEEVQEQLAQWMIDHQYLKSERAVKRFNAGKFAWMTGRAHPNAGSEELLLVAAYMSWLFMLDDRCDEQELGHQPERLQALHAELLDRMRNPRPITPEDDLVTCGLVEVWEQMLAIASPEWIERFINDVEGYANGCVWEAHNRAANIVPSVIEYTERRRSTSALYIFFDLVELADYVKLPNEVVEHEHIRNLRLLANDCVSWSNDIVSLEKELKANDVHSLVLVMQHEYRVSLQEAIDRATALFNATVDAYIELEQDTPSFGPEIDRELQRYLAGLRYWIRGSLDWSYESGRYGQIQPVAAIGK